MNDVLLNVDNLTTCFATRNGLVPAVTDISFEVKKGKCIGIVGESGSGKSVTALSILKLVDENNGKITQGRIDFEGLDLLALSERQMRGIRGNRISMIFQEPMTSLNPVFTVGQQIEEVLVLHKKQSKAAAKSRAIELLGLVGMPSPEARYREYPFQLSGGMRQRAMIAMALACEPQLLIADEPTTALDVTIQAQILDLLSKLRRELGMTMILITHDLGIVADVCDEVVVMYAGQVVECAKTKEIFSNPKHPYTKALLECIPKLGYKGKLNVIKGNVPSIEEKIIGCRFKDRCSYVMEKCSTEPPLSGQQGAHRTRCWLVSKEG
ncbi:MAG: ABC transporter ATP-binding protein [Oligoflexales bacterium]